MRQNSQVVLNTQFKSKLRQIIQRHPSSSITFSDYIETLRKNCIKFYSKDDIIKVNKLFDNPFKIARLEYVISFIELVCVQTIQSVKFLYLFCYASVVRSSSKPNRYFIQKIDLNTDHEPKKCFQIFKKIMEKLYGSEINWFKILGGVTIAVKIDKNVCKKNLQKILKNTHHSTCAQKLTKFFLKNPEDNQIQWIYFMELMRDKRSPTHHRFSSVSPFKMQTKNDFYSHTRKRSETRETQTSGFRASSAQNKAQSIFLQLDTKSCKLYKRQNSYSQNKTRSFSAKPQNKTKINFRNSENIEMGFTQKSTNSLTDDKRAKTMEAKNRKKFLKTVY